MSLLKDVAGYANQVDADLDKGLLESRGIIANVAFPDRGSVIYRLQVDSSRYELAVAILREVRPSLFGSHAGVKATVRSVRKQVLQLAIVCVLCAVPLFVFVFREDALLARISLSAFSGALLGYAGVAIYRAAKTKNG